MAGARAAKSGPGVLSPRLTRSSRLRRAPDFANFLENLRRLLAVIGMERAAQAVDADPVAGAFIAQTRTPAAGAFAAAVGRAANGVGAGAGNLQDSGAATEGRIEGDHLVADNLGALDAKVVEKPP